MISSLKWENLTRHECPYCGEQLEQAVQDDGMIHCTQCRFHIEPQRCKAILMHRGKKKSDTGIRLRWQNLIDRKCPMCGNYLRDGNGKYAIFKCISPGCTFHIREDRIAEIINDDDHPANRFHRKIRVHNEEEQSDVQ